MSKLPQWIEEIHKQNKAFKHWHDVRPELQPCQYSETAGPDLEVLVKALTITLEALEFCIHCREDDLTFYEHTKLMKRTCEEALQKIEKLGEEK